MLPDLSEIKARRKQHNLTQSELASLSGVSQSLIAKLEAGKIVPSYDKAKRLFDTLERMHEESGLCAKDVMTRRVWCAGENDTIKRAVSILEKKALSQLPVLRRGESVGMITERGVLARLGGEGSIDIGRDKVSAVMEEAAPSIHENTPLAIVTRLLDFSPAVLVKKKGKITGIITKSDLLKTMLKKA
jgi:predicted transcriptional regulator